jgi:hypothetical protein
MVLAHLPRNPPGWGTMLVNTISTRSGLLTVKRFRAQKIHGRSLLDTNAPPRHADGSGPPLGPDSHHPGRPFAVQSAHALGSPSRRHHRHGLGHPPGARYRISAWARLIAGDNAVGPVTHFDASSFATNFAAEVKRLRPRRTHDPGWPHRTTQAGVGTQYRPRRRRPGVASGRARRARAPRPRGTQSPPHRHVPRRRRGLARLRQLRRAPTSPAGTDPRHDRRRRLGRWPPTSA